MNHISHRTECDSLERFKYELYRQFYLHQTRLAVILYGKLCHDDDEMIPVKIFHTRLYSCQNPYEFSAGV